MIELDVATNGTFSVNIINIKNLCLISEIRIKGFAKPRLSNYNLTTNFFNLRNGEIICAHLLLFLL